MKKCENCFVGYFFIWDRGEHPVYYKDLLECPERYRCSNFERSYYCLVCGHKNDFSIIDERE